MQKIRHLCVWFLPNRKWFYEGYRTTNSIRCSLNEQKENSCRHITNGYLQLFQTERYNPRLFPVERALTDFESSSFLLYKVGYSNDKKLTF